MAGVRKNIVFNYGGQLYTTLIGILVLPLFLEYVGAEAYGLIGFYTLIQAWMTLLDLGMTPTLGREVARLRDAPKESERLVTIVNSLELVFLGIASLFAVSLILGRGWISNSWLNVETLPLSTVQTAVAIIGLTVAIRWVSSLSRSGINAFEHQVWLNVFEVVVNTLRFPVALLLMVYLGGDVLAYFYFQLLIVLLEVIILRTKLRRLMPSVSAPRFCWPELRRIAPFAIGIGYTAAIWVLLSQLDKLVLSKTLTLSEYGYFTLVATISSGVIMFSGPVSKAILPRMTALFAQGHRGEMILLYRRSTKLIVVLVAPIALTIAFLPYDVLYAWTGNESAAHWGQKILSLYVLGAALLTISAFQYYLQYVHGNVRYHVIYNTISLIINVPLIIFSALKFGPIGVAWAWFGFRLLSLLIWVPFIHRKFAPGLHKKWIIEDVLTPLVSAAIIVFIGAYFSSALSEASRFGEVLILILISVSATLVSAVSVFGGLIWSRYFEKRNRV
jgi:O-antigen/teichoic acid export membrane protein